MLDDTSTLTDGNRNAVDDRAAPADLSARAKSLAPLLEANAAAGEAKGALTDEVVDALHEGGFFAMWLPRAFGGAALNPLDSLATVESLCYADGSTGWVLMATALCVGTSAAYLEDAAVEEIYRDGRIPVMAGHGFPHGRAVPEEGGFRLTGAWSYASGLKHSDYVYTGGIVVENDEPRVLENGATEVRVFVIPRDKITLGDNWDVLGLRATGSIDYSVDNVFVPSEYTHIAATQVPRRGGSLFTLGLVPIATIGHMGFALGVGRRVLDELVQGVQQRAGRPGGSLGDSESFQERLAAAEGKYRAARAFAYETWGDITDTLERDQPVSTRQRSLIFLALNHATWAVQEVCMFAYFASGGISLRAGTLQRLFRDVHASTQHVLVAPPLLRACGRELSGLAAGHVWRSFELVEDA